jgi:hypothetical protein
LPIRMILAVSPRGERALRRRFALRFLIVARFIVIDTL